MTRLYIIISFISIGFLSCRKQLPVKVEPAAKKIDSVSNLSFLYLNAKARLVMADQKQHDQIEATATIRMKKDSIVWMNISPGLNIEALRVMFTSDSVFIVNKIDKVYSIYTYDELSRKINLPINLHMVQSLLLGNTILLSDDSVKWVNRDDFHVKAQKYVSYILDSYINSHTFKVEKFFLRDSMYTFSVLYTDFQSVDQGQMAPFKLQANINYKSREDYYFTNELIVDYKKIELHQHALRFPFSIPRKYERKQ